VPLKQNLGISDKSQDHEIRSLRVVSYCFREAKKANLTVIQYSHLHGRRYGWRPTGWI